MMSEYLSNLTDQFNSLPTWAKATIGVIAVGVPAYVLVSCYRNQPRKSPLKTDYEAGVVYVYQYPRNFCVPSLSPYALKLETWLRMNNVNYENVEISPFIRSKEGTLPFVEFNGKEYPDSGLIIKELTRLLNKDSHELSLTNEQKGAARAFEQMIENSTFWSLAWCRMENMDQMFSEKIAGPLPFFLKLPFMISKMKKYMKSRSIAHGIGRHTRDEIMSIGLDDLKAISNYLGAKKFLLGDQPTRVDAALFGSLAQMIYVPITTPHGCFIKAECPNLTRYCDRIKEKYWPDWQDKALNEWKNKYSK